MRGHGRCASGAAGVLVLALSALAAVSGCRRGEASAATSVVVISVDTLRADHLPAYGYAAVATPHIDALRRDAILYANAYSHVPLTLASHATIFTGLLPFQNAVRDNTGFELSPSVETLAGFLTGHHYATGAGVSAAVLAKSTGIGRGFEFYDDGAGAERRDGEETAKVLSSYLDGVRERPVFLFLHLFEPHAPYEPPEPFRSRYPLAYDGTIARADEIVGRFVARLKDKGLYDPALVIFLSDHGEGLGEHGELEHGIFLYRDTIRVPLLVKLPGSRRAGETVAAPVGLVDVFPTIARAVGLVPPDGLAGASLLEPPGDSAGSRRVYSETLYPRLRLGWSDLASLVDQRFQYIEAPRPELYDILKDPGETTNLAAQLPPALRSMRAELLRLPRALTLPAASDPEQARKLASLGYISATSPDAAKANLPDPKDRIGLIAARPDFADLLAKKDDAKLVRACREWLDKVPGNIEVWRLLADALDRQGKRGDAIAALQQGLRDSSSTAAPARRTAALERLTVLLAQAGRGAEVLEIADTGAFTDPEALNAIGLAEAKAGKLDAARAAFEKAAALEPGQARSLVNLGKVFLARGELDPARETLARAVVLDPKSSRGWSALGMAQARLGDETAALESWRRSLEIDPRQYDVLYNEGIAAGKRGDAAAARKALERFVREAPADRYGPDLAEARRLLRGLGGG